MEFPAASSACFARDQEGRRTFHSTANNTNGVQILEESALVVKNIDLFRNIYRSNIFLFTIPNFLIYSC